MADEDAGVTGAAHGPLVRICPSCGAKVWVQAEACRRCGASATPADAPAATLPDGQAVLSQPAAGPARRFALRPFDGGNLVALGVTLAVVLVLAAGVGVAGNWTRIGQEMGPSCSFGVTGTTASITVRGWTAQNACTALRQSASFPTYSLAREHADQPTICSVSVVGDQIRVHADSSDNAGAALCHALNAAASPPRTPPSP